MKKVGGKPMPIGTQTNRSQPIASKKFTATVKKPTPMGHPADNNQRKPAVVF